MAWVVLRFLLGAFGVILVALILGVFFIEIATWVKVSLFATDGVIGWSIKYVVAYLFPSRHSSTPQIPGS